MSSTPIRQPRGPPSSAFPPGAAPPPAPSSSSSSTVSAGPPAPDAESLLRRNKTLANPRSGNTPQQPAFTPSPADQRRSVAVFSPAAAASLAAAPQAAPAPNNNNSNDPRYRSGSFSGLTGSAVPPVVQMQISQVDAGLVRRRSGREFAQHTRTEETLLETELAEEYDSTATERGTWGKAKGLSRQSSLPSRRRK